MGEAKRRTHTTLLVCLKASGLKPSTVNRRCEGTASQQSPRLDGWRSSWSAGASRFSLGTSEVIRRGNRWGRGALGCEPVHGLLKVAHDVEAVEDDLL